MFNENENLCASCTCLYDDGFCMHLLYYPGSKKECAGYRTEPLKFSIKRIYQLCTDFIDIQDNINKQDELKEKYPERSFELNMATWKEFRKYCLNDLHRELSLYKTER